ncbi:hypoxia-inducible factor prolylhydroxylase [Daphnia sinensis]|uniref:hypoxia-inducible factor-proline dioxygenase n=1 Tax=Daphnia sinensis TaxID=1820382 RepID=A0AAD5KU67_9CRUS|nr:hypoxia-inducible factor prolylhydroxylase [Daphnia sinensis]
MNKPSSLVCHHCGLGEHLFRCARCRSVVYCSKEHQRKDWNIHKLVCHNPPKKKDEDSSNFVAVETPAIENEAVSSIPLVSDSPQCTTSKKQLSGEKDSALNIKSKRADQQYFAENSHDIHDQPEKIYPESQHKDLEGTVLEMGSATLGPDYGQTGWQSSQENSPFNQSTSPPFLHRSFNRELSCKEQLQSISMEWMSQICQYVVRDLEKYGICVVDNFMGKERAEAIHRSVVSMYDSGVFVEGETVSSSLETTKKVRSDKITWVDGSESNCTNIAVLISTIDTIIMNAIRMKGNGQLGQRTIGGRTKAMIACYPGSGSHYVKHVDNPNRDGRCITTTYYANKDWDAKTVGGLLRIFPQGWANQVVDIEPILDRMVFFWSDRRNPHEVQPAFRTRYAITVWYFDAKEREEARIRHRECALKKNKANE